MPVYEYRCKACGKTHQIQHCFDADRPTQCPACGGLLARVFHPVGLLFRGSGFHRTDYGPAEAKAAAPAAESKKPEPKQPEGPPSDAKSSSEGA